MTSTTNSAADSVGSAITTIQLDGLVLLKIIQHCKDSAPDVVSGSLLGLDNDQTLEITASFPIPLSLSESSEDAYQLEYMKSLRTVAVDNNTVGWYQSTQLGSFYSTGLIDAQYAYQQEIPNSIVIIFDPYLTSRGKLTIAAYRLTAQFMRIYNKHTITQETLVQRSIESDGILESVPIQIHNSHLIHGFLYELREQKLNIPCQSERLTLNHTAILDKYMNALSDGIDEFSSEQSKYQYYQRSLARQKQAQQTYLQRRAAENEVRQMQGKPELNDDLSKNPLFKPIPKPHRLDAYLQLMQMTYYTKSVQQLCGQTLTKLYLVDAFQRDAQRETTANADDDTTALTDA